MVTYARRRSVLPAPGVHAALLALSIAGCTTPISCTRPQTDERWAKPVPWPKITGRVIDPQRTGIANVAISAGARGTTAVTDADGSYVVEVPDRWSGLITPQHYQYEFVPPNCSYANVTEDIENQDYQAASTTNRPPAAGPQSVVTNEDTSVAIVLTGSDVDGNPLRFAIVTAPAHGVLTGTPPNLTYTPGRDYEGPDSFTFQVNDGSADSAAATVSISISAWAPPLGIPAPEFGITQQAPPRPDPWNQEVPGYYYVNYETGSDDRTYGTPASPRKTIPDTPAPGSVVEVHGHYAHAPTDYQGINARGTVENPVFIRGRSDSERASWNRAVQLKGSYCILEHINFEARDGQRGSVWFLAPADHLVLRHSDVSGDPEGGGAFIGSWGGDAVHDVVIYDCVLHDNGDWKATFDQDSHGISIGARANHVWIVDNEMYHNSGDGIQINAGSRDNQAATHHIYVGRNEAYQNKQTGFWCKQAVDVIFSQNVAHDHRPSGSSNGAGMGCQHDPERLWFIANHVYDCEYGIVQMSGSDQGTGETIYLIGNVIHNIHHTTSYDPSIPWSQAGIMLAGGTDCYVVNNTLYDTDAGINGASQSLMVLVNNIVSNITEPKGNHVFVAFKKSADASDLRNSLLYQGGEPIRLRWCKTVANTIATFQSATGKGRDCLESNPLFADPAAGQFQLQPGSPAIDVGAAHDVYAAFANRYGVVIAVDRGGTPRPQGAGYDIGADEFPKP